MERKGKMDKMLRAYLKVQTKKKSTGFINEGRNFQDPVPSTNGGHRARMGIVGKLNKIKKKVRENHSLATDGIKKERGNEGER